MYHAAAKSFVRVWLSVMRERTVLPYDCACADEFTGGTPRSAHPTAKSNIKHNSQVPSAATRPTSCATRVCCACIE